MAKLSVRLHDRGERAQRLHPGCERTHPSPGVLVRNRKPNPILQGIDGSRGLGVVVDEEQARHGLLGQFSPLGFAGGPTHESDIQVHTAMEAGERFGFVTPR